MTDDMPLEDLPYLEMLYKFAYSKKSYYDLLITRHVEPHSKDNDDEAEYDNEKKADEAIWR